MSYETTLEEALGERSCVLYRNVVMARPWRTMLQKMCTAIEFASMTCQTDDAQAALKIAQRETVLVTRILEDVTGG